MPGSEDPDLAARRAHPAILDLCGDTMTVRMLEMFLKLLDADGACTVRNCSGASLLEIGAELAEKARQSCRKGER